MSIRAASWPAWALAALSVAMFVATVALYVLARSAQERPSSGTGGTLGDLLVFVPFPAFPIVGALIASGRPRNLISWICLAAGFLWMLITLGDDATRPHLAMAAP
jgi:hypothetical protein